MELSRSPFVAGGLVILVVALLVFGFRGGVGGKGGDGSDGGPTTVDGPADITSLMMMKFSLPDMDKEMCETFPKFIVSSLEEETGVVDVSFDYSGHVVTVYYDPDRISREDILNYEVYSWVGTKFIEEKEEDPGRAGELWANREENNRFEMPDDHMANITEEADFKLVDRQEFPALVSGSWLIKNMDNVKIIEIGPESEYLKGHVAGAVNINIGEIRSTDEGVVKQIVTQEGFEALMRENGISNRDRVVVYSSVSLTHASRLFWTFKEYGHDRVAIVDGGKKALKGEVEFTKDVGEIVSSEYSVVDGNAHEAGIGWRDVMNMTEDDGVVLLDVRSAEEFKTGRIPGAINVDWTKMVNPDGTLKSEDELGVLLGSVDRSKRIVIYCESGTRASYAWFVLTQVLGFDNVELFDGSMISWRYNDLPQESG